MALRRTVPWALTALAVVATALLLLATRDSPRSDGDPVARDAGDAGTDPTRLAGRAEASPDVAGLFDDETDPAVLVGYGRSPPAIAALARERLAALVADDPALIGRLLEWMRPEYDGTRGPDFGIPPDAPNVSTNAPRFAERRLATLQAAIAGLGEPAVAPLLEALEDPDAEFRSRVMATLGRMGRAGARAVPALVERLSGERDERIGAIGALEGIGPAAGEALPLLHGFVRSGEEHAAVEDAAIRALFAIGGVTPELRVTLRQVVESGFLDATRAAVAAVERLGPEAAPLVQELLPLLTEHDGAFASEARRAIAAAGGGEEANARLVEALGSEHGDDVAGSAIALAKMGEEGDRHLHSALTGDRLLPWQKVEALGAWVDVHRDSGTTPWSLVVPHLEAMLADETHRHRAVALLHEAPVGSFHDALETWATGTDGRLAEVSRSGIGSLRDDRGVLAPLFVRWLDSDDEQLRGVARDAIARQPSDALRRRVLDDLERAVARGGAERANALSTLHTFMERDAAHVLAFLDALVAAEPDAEDARRARRHALGHRLQAGGHARAQAIDALLRLLKDDEGRETDSIARVLLPHTKGSDRIFEGLLAALPRISDEWLRLSVAGALATEAPLDPRVRSALRDLRDRATKTRPSLDATLALLAIR
jgi:hypothetical protein